MSPATNHRSQAPIRTAMASPRITLRSRSRSRTPSDSPHRARHVHPLSHLPQPQEVGITRAWVSLNREIHNLRITIGFLGLLVAAIINMPIRLGAAIRNRVAAINWIRRTTYDRNEGINVINDGTAFLRHHHQPYAQLLWLLAEAPRYTWHLRRCQRDTINTAAAAMTEYITTVLCYQHDYNRIVAINYRILDVNYLELFTNLIITAGSALQMQYRTAQLMMRGAPGTFPTTVHPAIDYFMWLHNRDA